MTDRILSLILLLIAGSLLGSCTRADPRFSPISSSTPGAYDRWRMSASDVIKVEEWREFDAACQELRLRIMANREASGHGPIESALRAKLHGATFREVLVMGLKAKQVRLGEERAIVHRLLNANAARTGVLSNKGPFAEFERARAEQEQKLLKIDEELRAVKRRLGEFGQY